MYTLFIIVAIIIILYIIGRISKSSEVNEVTSNTEPTLVLEIKNLMLRANKNLIVKDFETAVAICDKVLLIEPNNYSALVCRANSLEALNFNLDAIDDFKKAISIDNSDGNILGMLGLTYRKIGDLENGQKYLKASLDTGYKVYEMNYIMMSKVSEGTKKILMTQGSAPENLKRRNLEDFTDKLSEVDKNEFKKAVQNNLRSLEDSIALDPENKHLRELYDYAKSIIQ